jgi:hypothetical protein
VKVDQVNLLNLDARGRETKEKTRVTGGEKDTGTEAGTHMIQSISPGFREDASGESKRE